MHNNSEQQKIDAFAKFRGIWPICRTLMECSLMAFLDLIDWIAFFLLADLFTDCVARINITHYCCFFLFAEIT